MPKTKYQLHTIRIGERVRIIGTQKYTILDNGEKYYLSKFDYAVLDHQHLIANGSIQGSNIEKLTKEKLQETFDGILEFINEHGY